MNKHMEFAEAMRNIMRNKEEEEKKSNPKSADDDLEKTRSLQEMLEAKFDELFGTIEDEDCQFF